jgi:hypothetical protein
MIAGLSVGPGRSAAQPYQLYWGDIHNHNAVGYGKGSLQRSYDIAVSHLDFFAFTAHGQWHDMPIMTENKHEKWVNGFKATREHWDEVRRMAKDRYKPGQFVPFVAYEWHSSLFGDHCLIYPSDADTPLAYFDHISKVQAFAKEKGALLIPHHPAYHPQWRGTAFEFLDEGVSPVVEVFSEHGLAEDDRGPFDYVRHSNGGRWTPRTLRALLARGAHVGVVAGTDNHCGYPGAYREGLTGLYANELTREGIFEALRARRTFAVTGDRIALDLRVNGHPMGEALPETPQRQVTITATGWDEITSLELAKNGRVIARAFPMDAGVHPLPWQSPVLCRVEFGWGPWGDLNMARTCDWDFEVDVADGRLVDMEGCFRSGPFDEQRRNVVEKLSDRKCRVRSYTSRKEPLGDLVNNSVVLRIEGGPETRLTCTMARPVAMRIEKSLMELSSENAIEFTGPFTSESIVLQRLVFAPQYTGRLVFSDGPDAGLKEDWYYARVVQANGDLAISSPIWVRNSPP